MAGRVWVLFLGVVVGLGGSFHAESAEGAGDAENGSIFFNGLERWGEGAGGFGQRSNPPDTATGGTAATVGQERGAHLRVWLLTVGQGDFIWERFGHNAIRVLDETTGIDAAWNYGVFDFDEPGYYGRLVRGQMLYWLQPYDTQALINAYIRSNRSIWLQELNLTPAQRADLNEFLEWNGRDENRFYIYDYYRDNCSTRVRDAIDRVLGGQLAEALTARTGRATYRDHTQRLLADRIPEGAGTLLAMGPRADRPLDAWEEAFLPVQLMEQIASVEVRAADGTTRPLVLNVATVYEADRAPERTVPPGRLLLYTAVGIALAAVLLVLGSLARRSRAAGMAFHTLAFTWALFAGVFGCVIAGVWAFTDHTFTYNNENVLQISPLSLALAVLIPFGARLRGKAARLAVVVAGLSVLGLLIQVLPGIDQANGEIIGLALPIHTALALGLAGNPRTAARSTIPQSA